MSSLPAQVQQKITNLQTQLSQGLVGKEAVMKSALLTLVSGENILLIGPPGTAKSMVARRLSEALVNNGEANGKKNYFEYLLTKFSTPEELFGPLSISELKKDNFKRNTENYLPTVQVAFLDEIFKASSSILNALLTVLNERKFHNGTTVQDIPLQTLVAASNELPTGQSELSALYDRFLFRNFVGYVSDSQLDELFNVVKQEPIKNEDKLTAEDLQAIRQGAEAVKIPSEVQQAIKAIWAKHKETFKEDNTESLSDRRFVKVLQVLRVSAVTNGRDEVDLSDVMLLKDFLWNVPENVDKVREIVKAVLMSGSSSSIQATKSVNKQPTKIKKNPQTGKLIP